MMHLLNNFLRGILCAVLLSFTACTAGNSERVESPRIVSQDSANVATPAEVDGASLAAIQQRLAKLETQCQEFQEQQKDLTAQLEQTQKAATHFNIWFNVTFVLLLLMGAVHVWTYLRRRKAHQQLKERVKKLEKEVFPPLAVKVPTATKSGIQPTGAKTTAVPTQHKTSVSSSKTTTRQQTGAAQLQKSPETVKQKVNQQPKVTKLYAASCSSNILTEISGAPQENSAFVITLKNPNTAEFDIVSIDKIKSRNNLDEVVDYYGEGCTLSEATHYEVKQIGTCENTQQNCWKVTRKLQINISK